MEKSSIILSVVIAFVIGFIAGSIAVILKGAKEVKMELTSPTTSFSKSTTSPSIELTEKIEDLKEILRKNPRDLSAWVKLGKLYSDSGQTREAIETYGQYLTIQPNDPDVRTNLGVLLRKIGDMDGAIEEFEKAARADPKHSTSRYNLGLVLLHDKKDIEGAMSAWEDFLKVTPKGKMAEHVRQQMERLKTMTPSI